MIPGGAHTYSRGDDQHPANAPEILARGEGAYVYDQAGRRYLDYGMGLRAVTLGYANPRINAAAIAEIERGVNLTRPSLVELEAAEAIVDLIPAADMVKFGKNGSNYHRRGEDRARRHRPARCLRAAAASVLSRSTTGSSAPRTWCAASPMPWPA